MQLKLDMSCHLLNAYTKFQIDISKHVEEKSGKRGRTDGRTDRRTDGRTLPRHNTSRFSNGRIKTRQIEAFNKSPNTVTLFDVLCCFGNIIRYAQAYVTWLICLYLQRYFNDTETILWLTALLPAWFFSLLNQITCPIMTSSNGNIFRVTSHLFGEFTGEFPAQRPVAPSFDVFFDLRLNKRLSRQSWGWWFEKLSRPLWRHCNAVRIFIPNDCSYRYS